MTALPECEALVLEHCLKTYSDRRDDTTRAAAAAAAGEIGNKASGGAAEEVDLPVIPLLLCTER